MLGIKVLNPVFYISRLKPGDIAVDCGANVGKYTSLMAGQGAEVYAFEPNPYAFQALLQNNGQNKKIHCINKGVSDQNGQGLLYLHKNAESDQIKWSVGSSLLSTKGNVNPENHVTVELIDLADFINGLGREIKLVKMDIEGAEIPVINKLLATGAIKKIKRLVVEAHDRRMPELKEPMDKLKARIKKERIRNINLNWE